MKTNKKILTKIKRKKNCPFNAKIGKIGTRLLLILLLQSLTQKNKNNLINIDGRDKFLVFLRRQPPGGLLKVLVWTVFDKKLFLNILEDL